MKNLIFVFFYFTTFLLLFLSGNTQEYQFSENIVEALQRADFLFRRQNIEESLVEYENVIMMDESNLEGHIGIFKCLLKLDQLPQARFALENIFKYSLDQKLNQKLEELLDNAEKAEDQRAARDFFEKQVSDFEIATDPKLREQKPIKTVNAEEIFSVKTPRSRFAKSIQLHKKGFTSQAIPLFMDAIMEDSSLLHANDHGLLVAAKDYYQKSVNLNPKNLKSQFILGWILEQYADPAQAKTVYEMIAKNAPSDSDEKKIALGKLKFYEDQEKLREQAKMEEQVRLQQDTERFRQIQIANGQFPGYTPSDYLSKGQKLLEEKKIQDAIIHLQGAVKIDPNNPNAHYLYALAQVDSAFSGNENGFSIAKRELEKTISLDPEPELKRKTEQMLQQLQVDAQDSQKAP